LHAALLFDTISRSIQKGDGCADQSVQNIRRLCPLRNLLNTNTCSIMDSASESYSALSPCTRERRIITASPGMVTTPKPVGRHNSLPVKSLRGVFDTPLNGVWDTVGPQIRNLIKARRPLTLPASSPMHRWERRWSGVWVPSSYRSVSFQVQLLPIPPTRSPKRSLPFCRRTESKVLMWNGARGSRRGSQVPHVEKAPEMSVVKAATGGA